MNRFRLWKAAVYALQGLEFAWKSQASFRLEIILFGPLFCYALISPYSKYEKLGLLASLVLVLICELINTGIEEVCNSVTIDQNTHIKNAKDSAAAAVMMSIIIGAAIWCVIL